MGGMTGQGPRRMLGLCAAILTAGENCAAFLSEQTNALTALITAFAGEDCFGHVRLTHCERSEVASLAAVRL